MMNVEIAHLYARLLHDGLRYGDQPYYEAHLAPVAAALAPMGPDYEMVGVLHDAVEDTEVTLTDLRLLGAPEHVITAIDSVTRRDDESYDDLIERACADPIGRHVKRADNLANTAALATLARSEPERAERLREKYARALTRLDEAIANEGAAMDHNDAPAEHLPDGAIPTGEAAPEGADPRTMIGEERPVPPGMPKAPDAEDEKIATLAYAIAAGTDLPSVETELDRVLNFTESIERHVATTPRQALLAAVRDARDRRLRAAREWSRAVANRETTREAYLDATKSEQTLFEAMRRADLLLPGEELSDPVTPTRIPDEDIL